MDANSEVSRLYREQLKKNNIEVPETSSAADIRKVFPFLSVDIQRDTAIRGQDIVAETKDEDRVSRET
jgi:outer membrane lipopolysaccharide assembly protein LptE/RlpB